MEAPLVELGPQLLLGLTTMAADLQLAELVGRCVFLIEFEDRTEARTELERRLVRLVGFGR